MRMSAMKAAVLKEPHDLSIKEIPVPDPGEHEVLIRIMAVGVCGSDVHYYTHGRIGDYVVEKPLILGHECSGQVVKVGKNVKKIREGDRVAVEPGVPCGRCDYCRQGRYNLCPDVVFLATPPVDGSFVQYLVHHEDYVSKIHDDLSYEVAAMNEPFSVGLHACRRAEVAPGDTIAIFGMGPVGLLAILAARSHGAEKIIAVDAETNRLDVAQRMGATHCVNIREQDTVDALKLITEDKGADVTFEMAGHPTALQNAIHCVKRGGTVCIIGLPQQRDIPVDIPYLVDNELNVLGIFRYRHTYPQGLEILKQYQGEVEEVFTDTFPLTETKKALDRALSSKDRSIKVMVYPNW